MVDPCHAGLWFACCGTNLVRPSLVQRLGKCLVLVFGTIERQRLPLAPVEDMGTCAPIPKPILGPVLIRSNDVNVIGAGRQLSMGE